MTLIATERRYQGRIIHLDLETVRFPDGSTGQLEMIRHPGASAVVPLLDPIDAPDPRVLLIRQFRHAAGGYIWEIPAGLRDVPGEPPEVTANRELIEEAGYDATSVELLTGFYNSAGISDAYTYVFLGTGLRAVARSTQGVEEDHMEIATFPLDEAVAMVERGEINDAKTVIGLLLAARRVASSG